MLGLSTGCSYDWKNPSKVDGGMDKDTVVDIVSPDADDDVHMEPEGVPVADAGEGVESDALDSSDDSGLPVAAICFVDQDGDGYGVGSPMSCSDQVLTDSGLVVPMVERDGDCDDLDARRSPSLSDLCGDEVDNDCDSLVDDEDNNACGGSCARQLQHQPEEPCDNGLLGSCRREGEYVCQLTEDIECDAVMVQPSSELCGDDIDNDCDGLTDEADAIDVRTWFQDCDGDGFAASSLGSVRACRAPARANGCTWTERVPQPQSHSNWDCNDGDYRYSPLADFGFPTAAGGSFDLNCDGVTQKELNVASPNSVNPAWGLVTDKLCDASLSCNQCESRQTRAQWTVNGQATNVQPACSMSTDDTRTYRVTFYGLYGTACYETNTFAGRTNGLQRCR